MSHGFLGIPTQVFQALLKTTTQAFIIHPFWRYMLVLHHLRPYPPSKMVLPALIVLIEIQGKAKIASIRTTVHRGPIYMQVEGPYPKGEVQELHHENPKRDNKAQAALVPSHLLLILSSSSSTPIITIGVTQLQLK